jgi:hypothetical protein
MYTFNQTTVLPAAGSELEPDILFIRKFVFRETGVPVDPEHRTAVCPRISYVTLAYPGELLLHRHYKLHRRFLCVPCIAGLIFSKPLFIVVFR